MISQEYIKEIISYTPETGEFKWNKRGSHLFKNPKSAAGWNARFALMPVGVVSGKAGNEYLRIRINGKSYLAHRIAWLYVTGEFPESIIDHVDGDRLNNSFGNLRGVTHVENNRNRRMSGKNTSGYTGVSYCKRDKVWLANIGINGKQVTVGRFKRKCDAVKCRKESEELNNYSNKHGTDF